MKWEMEVEDIEAVLVKIWDLHDKLSDAIHLISRSQYQDSVNSLRKSANFFVPRKKKPLFNNNNNNNDSIDDGNKNRRTEFVFVKDDDDYLAVQEAKSLNAVRTAFKNLENQLEFFQTLQMQQRAERDAAIAHLEQSRIILAMRLAEQQGKKYEVIEEALAFVGDVWDAGDNFVPHEGKRSSTLIKVLLCGFNFAKKSLTLNKIGGILGNAALVAISMLALLHLHQVTSKDNYFLQSPRKQEDRNKVSKLEGSLSSVHLTDLNVMLARG